jgi:hypothetical protein
VLAVVAYFTLAIRRIFRSGWGTSLAKGLGIALLGIPINQLMFATAIVVTLYLT